MAARKSTARKSAARKTTARRTRKQATNGRRRGARSRASATTTATAATTTAAGAADLAGGLRTLLAAIDSEVRAVSALSERIDQLVSDLNGRREEQAKRLLTLDALRSSVSDAGLNSFLDKAIRPRKTRVTEVVPKRLSE